MCCQDGHFLKGATAFSCLSFHITACKILMYLTEINKYNLSSSQKTSLDVYETWAWTGHSPKITCMNGQTTVWLSPRINLKVSVSRFFFFLHSCRSSGWIGSLEEKRMASPRCHNDPGWWSIYEFRQIKHPWCPAAWGHLARFKVLGYQTFAEAWAAPFN